MSRFAWLALALAWLAPLLANDVPLVASVGGTWRFPALRSLVATPDASPGGSTWKDWWSALPEDATDWAVMPPWPYGPRETLAGPVLAKPGLDHPLGVDDTGRDQLALLLHGARTAATVAFGAVVIGLAIGFVLGGLAGLGGRIADGLVSRWIDVFACFPALLAILAVAAFRGGTIVTIVVVLGIVYQVAFARIVRGQLLSLRERPFVEAARGLGAGPFRLLFGHLLPELRGPVAVTAAFLAADAILIESTLTFLGLGSGIDTVSWGAMLDQGRGHAHAGAWHLWVVPALAVFGTVLALHRAADRLRVTDRAASAVRR